MLEIKTVNEPGHPQDSWVDVILWVGGKAEWDAMGPTLESALLQLVESLAEHFASI